MKMRLTLLTMWMFLNTSTLSHDAFAQDRKPSQQTRVISQALVFEVEKRQIEAVGSAEAVHSVDIFPAAADKVVAVNFAPGQLVSKGEVLLALDDRRQRTARERAKIQLADAIRNLKRLEQSKSSGASTESALDDAKTVKALAQVAVVEAQVDLDDRFVLAPFSGVVGLTDIEIGDRINLTTLVTTIDDREKLFVNFRAPEAAISLLQTDNKVTLQPWTDRQVLLDAKIAQVDSRVSETDRTVRVRALLDNSDDTYRPGMSFRVNLSISGQTFAVIPESGLSWGATGSYIWLIDQGKAKKVAVEIKQRLRGRILVSGDLDEGDQLIVEGIQRLREGQAVDAGPGDSS
ncbi:MAG: RND family efflux transporter MFP subunit [Candidatus Azotimanducaceae bacterium]|jgi:RND family efflux transporter MFP subunit